MTNRQRTTVEYGMGLAGQRTITICEGNISGEPLILVPAPGEASLASSNFSAILHLQGPEDRVIFYVEQLARIIPLMLNVDVSTMLPPDAWDHLPPRLLTTVQQGIVREDLRMTKRTLIAAALCISPNTITAYRTTIRKKFLSIPEEQRPLWMQIWLRRFPGDKRLPRRNKQSASDQQPADSNQRPASKRRQSAQASRK